MMMLLGILAAVGIVIISIVVSFTIGINLDDFLDNSDPVMTPILVIGTLFVSLIFIAIPIGEKISKSANKPSEEICYLNAVKSEALQEFEKQNKEELSLFRELYIDKCTKISKEQRDKVYRYILEHLMKQANGANSMKDGAINIAALNASKETENYKTFAKEASKYTDISFEGDILKLKFKELEVSPLCTCGHCGKEVIHTLSIHLNTQES